ncbi:dipeptidase 1-like isoform X2 [Zophobas morio]|uniref:dipeptidase 1-like isoform X2 n=1 Tax=Zophobas morio TaxID=2755281 RepID=UPI003083B704
MSTYLLFLVIFASAVSVLPTRDIPGRVALDNFPLIDGHNDLAYNLYNKLHNQIYNFSFHKDLSQDSLFGSDSCKSCNTDLVRIKKGKLGAQFWSAFVDCGPHQDAIVSKSFEQVDVIKRLIDKYPQDMEFVTTADGIEDAFLRKRLASLIGLEGGHSIDNKLALLRQFYQLGARYMTLTQSCSLPWADASPVDSQPEANKVDLTNFGKKIVLEMNRLGMMVDLSHVSHNVMVQAIDTSRAPVIFSHSSAYSVFPHHRNVKDDVILKIKQNGGIIMVNFYSAFLGERHVTIKDVARHINHIVDVAGVDYVGIGSDFDGVDSFPKGLEDVSKYPDLFDLLREKNQTRWTIENLEKLAGRNLYRVFKKVEEVRDTLLHERPDESLIPDEDLARAAGSVKKYSKLLTFITVVVMYTLRV